MKGIGDQIDYGERVHDPRVGRFYSVDPIGNKYLNYRPISSRAIILLELLIWMVWRPLSLAMAIG